MGSELGIADEKILALAEYATSPLYGKAERVERVLRTLETRAAGLDADGAATRLTGLPE